MDKGNKRPWAHHAEMTVDRSCLEGHVDLVSRLIMGRTRVTKWVIGAINLVTTSPDPPSGVAVLHVGGCQNDGRLLDPDYNTTPNI